MFASYLSLYERSTCRYIRLNALNVLHIHGPNFNTPVIYHYVTYTLTNIRFGVFSFLIGLVNIYLKLAFNDFYFFVFYNHFDL